MSYFMQRNGVDDIKDPMHRANASRMFQRGEINSGICKIGSRWGRGLDDSLAFFVRPETPGYGFHYE